LIVLRADAVAVMAQKFPDETVDELIFFYPNPTPKKRQANQRFFVGAQFEVFDRSLKTHAILLLATNIKAYLDEAECFLKQVWGYHILSCGPLETAHIPRSAFEKKYHARGDVLFELIAQKP
ncbi:MAG TPA: hypothetical protein VJC18_07395, partial [bacterium]|nr:hypothetical protein [bacterium]